jgi:hypothetical protein
MAKMVFAAGYGRAFVGMKGQVRVVEIRMLRTSPDQWLTGY